MVDLKCILCPVDLSETSEHALHYARSLAQWYGATLTVLEVISVARPPMAFSSADGATMPPVATPAEREVFLEELGRFCGTGPAPQAGTALVIREGAVAREVLDEARTLPADLIVIGTHGREGFDRALLGSITEKVLRKAPCPVLTIPPRAPDRDVAPRLFKTMICAIDFSPASLKALEFALFLAQESAATLLLVHVVEWPSERPLPPWSGPAFSAEQRRLRDEAQRELHLTVPDDVRTWCPTREIVSLGRPHEEIVKLAHDHRADLIVLGVHGRSDLGVFLFGSTTNQVVRHAGCPVLTIRPADGTRR